MHSHQQAGRVSARLAIMVVMAVLGALVVPLAASPAQAATGNILPPFDLGQAWNICRGYGYMSHTGTSTYGLDLTGAGCDNSASGRTVRAPISGSVYYYQASYGNLCVNIAGGRSYTLTHIDSGVTGGSVAAGQAVGNVAPPNTRGNAGVAHIHFQLWDTANCYSSSGIPFDSAHGARICGAPDLTASGPSAGNGVWSGTRFTGQACGSSSPAPKALKNGGFETSGSWSASGIGFARYTKATGGIAPAGGSYFAAINNPSGGGSLKQDTNGTVKAGASYCLGARVTSRVNNGAHGTMALWFLGGTTEKTDIHFSGLTKGSWRLIRVCHTVKYAHTGLRVEFYPDVNTPDLGVDNVLIFGNMAKNGGFNNGSSSWAAVTGGNFTTYTGGYEGTRYAATNASKSGGGFRQDISGTFKAGVRYCLDAQVATAGDGTGGSVDMVLYGLSVSEKVHVNTGPMTTAGWRNISTCLKLAHGQSKLRVQFYPQVGGKTINVDSVWLRQQ